MNPPSIRGLVPPVPTPFKPDGTVDEAAFQQIAAHLHRGGVDAAFVLGSTGELASLSGKARRSVLRAAAAAFGPRLPWLAGIGDPCLEESLALAGDAADAGATALVLNAPSYYDISSRELRAYFEKLIPRLPLPVMLYNMPWLTGHSFDDDTLRHAMDFPGVIGFKDSSGDLAYLARMINVASDRPELSVLIGNDFLYLEALALGAHGAVAGGSNLYPELFRALTDAFQEGDLPTAEGFQREITSLGQRIFNSTGNPSSVFASIKAGLSALGLCDPAMMPPIESCRAEVVARLASILSPAAAA